MAISASMVKELRQSTGVGMMDCKNALTETDGNMEAAVDWLRAKGLSKAAKKSGRIAAEGLVGIFSAGNKTAVVEVNSETDFVSRNDQFQEIVRNIAEVAHKVGDSVEAISNADYAGSGKTVSETLTAAIATIGENMNLRRASVLSVENGVVASYVHNAVADGLGRLGVLVALESTGDRDKLNEIGRQVAMHVAATSPLAINVEEVDPVAVERERAVFSEQARASGKPDSIIEKMVDGKMRKFFQEVVLLQQTFVVDGENTVEQALKNAEEAVGAPITLKAISRIALGDGIEKKQEDFAAEVAAASGQS
ncbi:MAG: elongation factor Ts [Hyphomicrobiales bacterium]|nr:MAG: elongation factor Ts [Hyphomicrobiales bacterium]